MYQVFERINTSGRTLTAQEIRNCVYQGSFNKMLFDLNKNLKWRKLFGSVKSEPRMRDIEFILRFFVINSISTQVITTSQISLKKEQNDFMSDHKNDTEDSLTKFSKSFLDVIDLIYDKLGENAFRNYVHGKFITRFHPTIFDAISVAFYKALEKGIDISKINKERHIELLHDKDFQESTTIRTTDIENILKRISLAFKYLIG